MNLGEAQANITTARQRIQDEQARLDQQQRIVRDYEQQINKQTSESDIAEVARLTGLLTAARAIVAACNRQVSSARAELDRATTEERHVRERIGTAAQRVAASEGNIRSLNRNLQEAEHRVEALRAGLASEQRSLARDKAELAALKSSDVVPAMAGE